MRQHDLVSRLPSRGFEGNLSPRSFACCRCSPLPAPRDSRGFLIWQVEWYLNQQEDITNLDDLAAERRLVRQIIQRLLTFDKILVHVEAPEEAAPAPEGLRPHDLRFLSVRPHVEL